MTYFPIELQPGLFLNRTAYGSAPRWQDGNLIRFRDGGPEQIGGWAKVPVAGVQSVPGAGRAFITWRPNDQSSRFGVVGSSAGATLFDGGSNTNITPTGFPAGRVDSILGAGYGIGLMGAGAYGTPRVSGSQRYDADTWTLDLWGELLVGVATNNSIIYEFLAGTDARFKPMTGAPTASALVVTDERHIFALAAGGNPARISWCDREDRNNWTPSATNRAGGYTLQTSGRLRCGRRGRGQTFVWSDEDLFGFYPTSNSLVYGYDRLGTKCGVIGPNAVAMVGDVAYWMGVGGFYIYDGAVRKMESDVYDYVFKNISLIQRAKVQVVHNSLFDEVLFFFVSAGSVEIDRYVSYNYTNQTWSKGELARTTWADRGVFESPLAVGADGMIYQHESGSSADGALMPSFAQTYPMELGRGDMVQNVFALLPDIDASAGAATMTLLCRYTPQGPQTSFGPYLFDNTTDRICVTASGRQVAFRIDAAAPGDHWELGRMRLDIAAGGGR